MAESCPVLSVENENNKYLLCLLIVNLKAC